VAEVLRGMPPHVHRVWIPWKIFGSNGYLQQPDGVVRSFTHRASGISLPYKKVPYGYESHLGTGKMVVRGVLQLHVHESQTIDQNPTVYSWDPEHTPAHLLRALPVRPLLELNHYMYMSRAYYQDVKCARGGGQTGHETGKYTMTYFDLTEPACNTLEDTALSDKKKALPKGGL
jgi:hypothetical protein